MTRTFYSKLLSFIFTVLISITICISLSGNDLEQVNRNEYIGARQVMVGLLIEFGIKDRKLLQAMSKVKRHLFIPEKYRDICDPYGNHPCPIGYGQTISQPYIVAYMTERLGIRKGENVLEVGAGSGYQAAVISELGAKVTTLEIIKELSEHADNVLAEQGYKNVKVVNSSGYIGYPGNAPYDAIIVTCAPPEVPSNLIEELKEGGRLILPVGKYYQKLLFIVKQNGKIRTSEEMNVRFVPMVE